MKFLIDVCLSPEWTTVLQTAGYEAFHWLTVGSAHASDSEILRWALENDFVVFTHDLDFGAILAATEAAGPSVLQLREQDTDPATVAPAVLLAIDQCRASLGDGALVTVDLRRSRFRVLPIRSEL
jgi:predicted nuclease of predicted toxin-antitoxin system